MHGDTCRGNNSVILIFALKRKTLLVYREQIILRVDLLEGFVFQGSKQDVIIVLLRKMASRLSINTGIFSHGMDERKKEKKTNNYMFRSLFEQELIYYLSDKLFRSIGFFCISTKKTER